MVKKPAPKKKAVKKAILAPRKQKVVDNKVEVIRLMEEGMSLRSICAIVGMPSVSSVMEWANDDKLFAEQYAHARIVRAEVYFDELDDVSDAAVKAETSTEVAGLRLKSDNIKWKLARMNAKKYGDKLDLTQSLTIKSSTDAQLDDEITRMTEKLTRAGVV